MAFEYSVVKDDRVVLTELAQELRKTPKEIEEILNVIKNYIDRNLEQGIGLMSFKAFTIRVENGQLLISL